MPPDGGRPPTILAMGGGGFTAGVADPALDELVLRLTGTPRPRLCLLPTAGGDSEHQIRRFYETYGDRLASRRTSRCSASAASRCRCASTCSPRTRSTSAAARWSTCSRSGALKGSTRSCARRGTGRRARRAQRRLDVLVRVGRHHSAGAPRRPPASASSRARTRSTTTASPPGARSTRGGAHRRHPVRLGRRRRRRADLPPHRLAEVVAARPAAHAYEVDRHRRAPARRPADRHAGRGSRHAPSRRGAAPPAPGTPT